MDECIDQQAAILYPPQTRAQPRIILAHAALANQFQDLKLGESRRQLLMGRWRRLGRRPFPGFGRG